MGWRSEYFLNEQPKDLSYYRHQFRLWSSVCQCGVVSWPHGCGHSARANCLRELRVRETGSKFALEAISETLSKEVKDFGIRVTAVAPGQFRTDWAGRSMIRSKRIISDYGGLMNPLRKARQEKSGKQPGDPAKAAQVLLKIIEDQNPPTHLLLGNDALKLIREKLETLNTEFALWEQMTRSTDSD